jgi:hypothetical protein
LKREWREKVVHSLSRPRLSIASLLLGSLSLSLVALLGSGCGLPQKQFRITSYPPGADIYVESEKRGQTDAEKLAITFYPRLWVRVRVEKAGYQPAGTLLGLTSPDEVFFVLEEASHNQETADSLKRIESLLERLPGRIAEREPPKGAQ